jgi:hypothetical protein
MRLSESDFLVSLRRRKWLFAFEIWRWFSGMIESWFLLWMKESDTLLFFCLPCPQSPSFFHDLSWSWLSWFTLSFLESVIRLSKRLGCLLHSIEFFFVIFPSLTFLIFIRWK